MHLMQSAVRLCCIECRNRTGSVFCAAIGCRTFKELPNKENVHATLMSYKLVATLTLIFDILMLANALNRVLQCTHVPIKAPMEEVDRFVADVERLYLGHARGLDLFM